MSKYSKTFIAAMIVVAIAIATFIYSIARNGDDGKVEQPLDNGSSAVKLSPGANVPTPKTAPNVTPPTTPPPAN